MAHLLSPLLLAWATDTGALLAVIGLSVSTWGLARGERAGVFVGEDRIKLGIGLVFAGTALLGIGTEVLHQPFRVLPWAPSLAILGGVNLAAYISAKRFKDLVDAVRDRPATPVAAASSEAVARRLEPARVVPDHQIDDEEDEPTPMGLPLPDPAAADEQATVLMTPGEALSLLTDLELPTQDQPLPLEHTFDTLAEALQEAPAEAADEGATLVLTADLEALNDLAELEELLPEEPSEPDLVFALRPPVRPDDDVSLEGGPPVGLEELPLETAESALPPPDLPPLDDAPSTQEGPEASAWAAFAARSEEGEASANGQDPDTADGGQMFAAVAAADLSDAELADCIDATVLRTALRSDPTELGIDADGWTKDARIELIYRWFGVVLDEPGLDRLGDVLRPGRP